MDELGFVRRDTAPEGDVICDIVLEHEVTKHVFVTDVMVTHPKIDKPEYSEEPLVAAKLGVEVKFKKYVDSYHIAREDVIPLVFETYGGYAKETFDFFKVISLTIANNEQKLADKLMRALRERIAVALHTHQAYLIHWINGRERYWARNHRTAQDGAEAGDMANTFGEGSDN
jgi:hypothetical protein